MRDVYSVIEEKAKKGLVPQESFDVDAWAAKKKQQRDDTFKLADDTAIRVNTDPEALEGYLDVMARFGERSASNALLIFAQRPEASRVADSETWAKENARIKKGERGIAVLTQGDGYTREDGSLGSFYEVSHVFDASQTTARKILPQRYQESDVVMALAKTAQPQIVAAESLEGGPAAYDKAANTIHLQKGLSQTQVFWALARELAQAEFAGADKGYSREAYRGRAELAARVLARRYGIEAPEGKTIAPAAPEAGPKEIRRVLTCIQKATKSISQKASVELNRPKEQEKAMVR